MLFNWEGIKQIESHSIAFIFLILLTLLSLITNDIEAKSLLLVVTYLLVTVSSIISSGILSVQSLFLYTFGLFLLSVPIASTLSGDMDILLITRKYRLYRFSDDIIITVFKWIQISLMGIGIGLYLPKFNYSDRNYKIRNRYRKWFLYFGYLLFIMTAYKLYFDYNQISLSGFLGFYNGERISAPLIFRMAWFAFKVLFPLYLLVDSSRKGFFIVGILYLIFESPRFLTGDRSSLLLPVFYLLWLYKYFYNPGRLYYLLLSFFAVSGLAVSYFLMILREGLQNDVSEISLNTLVAVLMSQGVTFHVICYYVEFKSNMLNTNPLALFFQLENYVIMWSTKIAHTLEYINVTSNIDHLLMYAVNPKQYLLGRGLGSSYIIELMQLGRLPVLFFISVLVGRVLRSFESIYFNTTLKFLGPILFVHVLYMPRQNLIPDLLSMLLLFSAFKLLKILRVAERES